MQVDIEIELKLRKGEIAIRAESCAIDLSDATLIRALTMHTSCYNAHCLGKNAHTVPPIINTVLSASTNQ